ncbi:hypothetical protein B0T22DRAFT_230417 [Podospora appendiculata]|uniref:Uncharacterized protein n=1 Tax=Podospora appendiculata TaxID=314037 RepID=A0AAE0X6C3_9PEZI|nr:hypothetical protein B0T22DRAFT_230417 [Podospora appendiculata]
MRSPCIVPWIWFNRGSDSSQITLQFLRAVVRQKSSLPTRVRIGKKLSPEEALYAIICTFLGVVIGLERRIAPPERIGVLRIYNCPAGLISFSFFSFSLFFFFFLELGCSFCFHASYDERD